MKILTSQGQQKILDFLENAKKYNTLKHGFLMRKINFLITDNVF